MSFSQINPFTKVILEENISRLLSISTFNGCFSSSINS